MDTIVPNPEPGLKQIVRFIELLGVSGVGEPQIQQFNDDVELRVRVTRVMRQDSDEPLIDIADSFDQSAMNGLVEHIFRREIGQLNYPRSEERFERSIGHEPKELATTQIIKDLLDGLSPLHIAICVLRSGLLDGKEAPARDVANQFHLTLREVSKMRGEITTHIKARQRRLYPISMWIPKQSGRSETDGSVTEESRIDVLQLETRVYKCLKREGITTIGELAAKSRYDLADIRNLGLNSIDDIEAALIRHKFYLAAPQA